MITAAEIARELGVDVYRVRYRLDQLRADDAVSWKKVGQTFVYDDQAMQVVKDSLAETNKPKG